MFSGPGPGAEVHAAGYPRLRRVVLDLALLDQSAELARIVAHELFHFVWFRLGNGWRLSWELLLQKEFAARARGELGWSAEWRKRAIGPEQAPARTRAWREYACESFCDSAAWLYSGVAGHPEYTLGPRHQARRRAWFATLLSHFPAGLRI